MSQLLPERNQGTVSTPRHSSSGRWTLGLRPAAIGLVVILLLFAIPHALASSARKQKARDQFEKAGQMREALNGRPEQERTRRDYQRVADAYRKVYYTAPDSSKADASVVAVAELLAEMGRQFQPGDKDLNAAIQEYEFLRREYPGSKYRFEALFTIGQIYKEDLGDDSAARKTFDEFLAHYPRNSLAPEARKALAELNRPKPAKKPSEEAHSGPPGAVDSSAPPSAQKKASLPMVTGIRHWSTPDYTRVAIDLDSQVKYEAGSASNPDRIFFDLPDTRLASVLVGKSFDVQDGFLRKIRVAQYQPEATRVVLEVADVSNYSAFLLPNPYRLIIDIHGRQTQVAKTRADDEDFAPAGASMGARSATTSNVSPNSQKQSAASATGKGGDTTAAGLQTAGNKPPRRAASSASARKVIVDEDDEVVAASAPAAEPQPSAPATKSNAKSGSATVTSGSARTAHLANSDDSLLSPQADTQVAELKATTEPTSAPTAVAVSPPVKATRKSSRTAPDRPSAHEAMPTSAGERSLTRALGLKIGRIVVDAGHGGHDTGTISPNGLMEKDLVLDVALRLGRLLETRLGADVILTRDDDTFIPLETRTAIANEHRADLFISIHANSSPDPNARGIETYYLNFTSNPDALEVAARENAVSEKSIYELQDLVKKITLKDKIEESRELATDVQQSLYSGLSTRRSTLRDRGVKKAPFVVLIGANMPSILAEISFVSNPTDAAKLETPEYREKIAESLYRGIAHYVDGLSGVKVASKTSKASNQ